MAFFIWFNLPIVIFIKRLFLYHRSWLLNQLLHVKLLWAKFVGRTWLENRISRMKAYLMYRHKLVRVMKQYFDRWKLCSREIKHQALFWLETNWNLFCEWYAQTGSKSIWWEFLFLDIDCSFKNCFSLKSMFSAHVLTFTNMHILCKKYWDSMFIYYHKIVLLINVH